MALASSSRSEDPMGCLRETTYHGMVCERRRSNIDLESQVMNDVGDSQLVKCPTGAVRTSQQSKCTGVFVFGRGGGEFSYIMRRSPDFGVG